MTFRPAVLTFAAALAVTFAAHAQNSGGSASGGGGGTGGGASGGSSSGAGGSTGGAGAGAAAGGLGSGLGGGDERTPFYYGAGLSVTHDSNVFRVGGGTPKDSDIITSGFLLAGLDQPIGRQRVYGDARVATNRYQDISNLNNTSYALTAGLDWSTIERLAGNLSIGVNQSLARFNPGDAPTLTIRNTQQSETASATVRLGIVTRLALTAGLTYRQQSYSAESFNFREFNQTGISGGVEYRFSGLLRAGAALRHTEATYPRFIQTGPDTFRKADTSRNDLDLTAQWTPTGASSINGRVSIGQRERRSAADQDSSGVTAAITWNWRPTGKLRFATTFVRETGQDSNFGTTSTPGSAVVEADNSRISNSLQTGVNYALTSKIGINANARYVDRTLDDTRFGTPLTGDDQTTYLSVGVNWAPTRTIGLGCNATNEHRSTAGGLSTGYTAGTIGCSAQIVLQ